MVVDFFNSKKVMSQESIDILLEMAGKGQSGAISAFITVYLDDNQLKFACGGDIDTDKYIAWLERLKFEMLVNQE